VSCRGGLSSPLGEVGPCSMPPSPGPSPAYQCRRWTGSWRPTVCCLMRFTIPSTPAAVHGQSQSHRERGGGGRVALLDSHERWNALA
jgi:hypothetical protein